jgi:tetratricopeptide (TPR) repeat protein
MDVETLALYLGIIGVPLTIAGWLFVWLRKRHKIRDKYFKKIENSRDISPRDLLDDRPYHTYYYKRPEDDDIRKALEAKQNVLIIGSPLAGKSRAAFEALKNLNKKKRTVIVNNRHIEDDFRLPFGTRHGGKGSTILVIDDLQTFVEQINFEELLQRAKDCQCTILATCRSGFEFNKTNSKMTEKSIYLEELFLEKNTFEMLGVSEEVAQEVAHGVKKDWADVRFDGRIGSVMMPLMEMEKRFGECSDKEKTILKTLKNLYICGIYKGNQLFPFEWVKLACEKEGLKGEKYEWDNWLDSLKGKDFLKIQNGNLHVEQVYLEDIVQSEPLPTLQLFEEMSAVFLDIPDALYNLASRSYNIGLNDLDKANYMKISIKSCNKCLEHWNIKDHEEDYARTLNLLGLSLTELATIEDKAANCRKAIVAYDKALKVYTLKRFPMDYAMTQNNLGNAYWTLSGVEDKAANCKKAITAYNEALKVRTFERFPIQYAMTQNNLGAAYGTFSQVEDKAANCRKAIAAYNKALKVRTLERFPMDYAMTQNNLGIAYRNLGDVEEKADNCRKAITSYNDALKVYTYKRFPMDYAMTQNNLGAAYGTFSQAEDKAANCRKAIAAFNGALKVDTLERFPIQYARDVENLGVAYWTLAEAENKKENCRKALEFIEEAIAIYIKEELTLNIEKAKLNLENLKRFCEES